MAIQPMALQVQNVQGNALGAFAQGQQHAMDQRTQQLEISKQNLGWLAQMAHDAEGDPAKWDAGLDMMQAAGWSPDMLSQFRGRADLAPMLAKGALTAQEEFSQNFNERQLEQSWKRLAFEMQEAAKGPKPTAQIQNFEYGQANPAFNDWVNSSGASSPTVGTTVLTGRDAQGNIVPLQAGSDGNMVQSQLPDGVRFDPGALNAERAAGNVIGRGSGQAALDLPGAATEVQRISTQIADLKAHPGLDEMFGGLWGTPWPNQWTPTIPNTNKANAQTRIDQMSGNAFLNGRALLKGQGQITDFESRKAEAAFARLSTAQSKDEFIAALDEFQQALEDGYAKIQAHAQGTQFSAGDGSGGKGGASAGADPLGLF